MKYLKRIERRTWFMLISIIIIWILDISILKSNNKIVFAFDIFISSILTIEFVIVFIIELLYNINPVEITGIVSQYFAEECVDVTYNSFIAKTGQRPSMKDVSFIHPELYRLYNIHINDSMRNKCENGNLIKFISNDNYSYNVKKLKEKAKVSIIIK